MAMSIKVANSVAKQSEKKLKANVFPSEIQFFSPEQICDLQAFLDHGSVLGEWLTSPGLVGEKLCSAMQRIVFRKRLVNFIPRVFDISNKELDGLLQEAELWMARYLLLLDLGPSALVKQRVKTLDLATINTIAYKVLPPILISGVLARLAGAPACLGLVRCISPECLAVFNLNKHTATELKRMRVFFALGMWSDVPAEIELSKITNPSGSEVTRQKEQKAGVYKPLPDDYLMAMGPRVLWVINTLGPAIIKLGREMCGLFEREGHPGTLLMDVIYYLKRRNWLDADKVDLWIPNFSTTTSDLKTDVLRGQKQVSGWFKPGNWSQVQGLFYLLQTAHLWVCFLATGGRVSEVLKLSLNCFVEERDGNTYVRGKRYKFSSDVFGDVNNWVAPDVLLKALLQQRELIEVSDSIRSIRSASKNKTIVDSPLWLSFRDNMSGSFTPVMLDDPLSSLKSLACRLGVNPMPDGISAHPHRFRKTMARLVGVAVVEGPKVLARLLGHKDVSTAVAYILSDKALQVEINAVSQELRILKCKEVVSGVHSQLHSPDAADGRVKYGGGAMPGIKEAVAMYEERLNRMGSIWSDTTAYDLAKIMTFNGVCFRQIRPGVICTKPSRQVEVCACTSDCINRIEEGMARRDVSELIPKLIEQSERAILENHLLVGASLLSQIDNELSRFTDIAAHWKDEPRLQMIRKAMEE